MAVITATVQLRRDTAANWTANNPVLLAGEIGIETDTTQGKLGDGVTTWNVLTYITSWGSGIADGDTLALGLNFPANGLKVLDTNGSHYLTIKSNEDLTANARLEFILNDSTRIVTIPGDATISGVNTGDQTNIPGNAATVTTNANLTGPVTSTGNATAIANGAISNAMLANSDVANLSGTNTGDQTLTSLGVSAFAQTILDDAAAGDVRTTIGAGTGNGNALVANPLSQFAATTSAQLSGVISDEMTGAGTNLAFGTSGIEAAYTGTPTWTATAAPSGASSLRQFYTQVGNMVTWNISLTYATTGTVVTNVVLTFPTEFPTPAIPTGFTGANVHIWNMMSARFITTPSGTITNGGSFMINRNAGDTAFEISGPAVTANNTRTVIFSGSYFTS